MVGFAGLTALPATADAAAPSAASNPAALPAAAVDPGKPGKYQTVTGEYSLPAVHLPDFPGEVEMQAVVVAPKGANGPRPLAVFLHGRHLTCYGDEDLGESVWPCPAKSKPIPNYRGYLRAQRLLASQGYITVSISANGVTAGSFDDVDGDHGAQAGSSLIRLHLAHWAVWAADRTGAPAIVRKSPRADLSKVFLMGHGEGGEAVNRAAMDSLNPPPSAADGYHGPVRWTIRGTLLLAPTSFGHNPEADVPSVVVLPGCDGNAFSSDLGGQYAVDGTRGLGSGTALHSAVFVIGANHNYFNTEWTPGLAVGRAYDDWFRDKDAVCGKGKKSLRLTPVQQQKVGATYIAAAARLFVKDDDRVLPLLDGSGVRAPSVGKARVLSQAVGAARQTFILPADDLKVTGAGATTARLCREVSTGTLACLPRFAPVKIPHFVGIGWVAPEEPDRYAVDLQWSKAGGSGVKLQPKQPVSLAGSTSVTARIIVPANSAATKFDVVIADTAGRKATLGRVSITGLPGTKATISDWAQEVRAPLKAARKARLDLSQISRLQLIPRSSKGKAWVLDAWGWRTGTPAVRVAPKARVDIGPLAPVAEADAATTIQIPVTVSGNAAAKVRFYISGGSQTDPTNRQTLTEVVTIPPGATQLNVPLTIHGDTTYSTGWVRYWIVAEAMPGSVVGDFIGELNVTEDDPAPTVTVKPVTDQVTEGGTLKWQLKLSEPAVDNTPIKLVPLPPTGAELSTTDLTAEWSMWEGMEISRTPSRPLSKLAYLLVWVPGGATTVDFFMPTQKDTLVEGPEQVRLQVQSIDGHTPAGPEMTGTVNDPRK
jgi:hypothetical protein